MPACAPCRHSGTKVESLGFLTDSLMKKLNALLFYSSLLVLLVSYLNRNEIQNDIQIEPSLLEEPVQSPNSEIAFEVTQDEQIYSVEPLYDYELTGLVVSYHHSDSFNDLMHKRSGDYFNVADLCVVWGQNVLNHDFDQLTFWNRDFTCYFETDNPEVWQRFDQNGISNNHLLTDNDYISSLIKSVKVGYIIKLSGFLVNYSNNDTGYNRNTSITRTDRGNGACETIYVNDFEILQTANQLWWSLLKISLFVTVISALIWVFAVGTGKW